MIEVKKIKDIMAKATAVNSQPTECTFPELPTVLIWFRFLLAAAYGSYLGLGGVRSGTMAMHSLNLIAFVPFMYCRLYLGVKEDAYGMKLITSGLMNALALSLLLWIYFFTAQHEDDEAKMAALLVSGIEGDPVDASAAADLPPVVLEDSEPEF